MEISNKRISGQFEWLSQEIGFVEGRRRIAALQRQLNVIQRAEKWSNIRASYISKKKLTEAQVSQVDRILQISTPWPTFLSSKARHVSELAKISINPAVPELLQDSLGTTESKLRLNHFYTMQYRWNPHTWLNSNQIQQINQQFLSLDVIFLVGDCLQFGRKHMTATALAGILYPETSFEMLWSAFHCGHSVGIPWCHTAERAWLMATADFSNLYTTRLQKLKELLNECTPTDNKVIDIVNQKGKLNFTGEPWWNLGHLLIWEDQGLNLSMMASVGIKMNLRRNQNKITKEEIEKLKSLEEIPNDEREKVVHWFEEEFQNFSESKENHNFLESWSYSFWDVFTTLKGYVLEEILSIEQRLNFFRSKPYAA